MIGWRDRYHKLRMVKGSASVQFGLFTVPKSGTMGLLNLYPGTIGTIGESCFLFWRSKTGDPTQPGYHQAGWKDYRAEKKSLYVVW